MQTRDHETYTVDPEDTAAIAHWAQERAAKVRELAAAHARRRQLAAALADGEAPGKLDAQARAHDALASARAAGEEARERAADADAAAAHYEAQELADAVAGVDAATRTLSDELGVLFREAPASTALTATVDGLALRERFRAGPPWDHTTIPFGSDVDPELGFPAVDADDHAALLAVLERLDERVDAVADLVTAESVHQLVQGNPTRAGASLAVAASGMVPDQFEVVQSPRDGHEVSHRVLVLLDPAQPPAWTGFAAGVDALVNPRLAAWVSRLVPDPARILVQVARIDPDTGDAGHERTLPLSALGLDALSWLRLAGEDGENGELEQRIAYAARESWRESDGDAIADTGEVIVDDQPGLTLDDLLAAAHAVSRVLATARPLEAADLTDPAGGVARQDASSAGAGRSGVGGIVDAVQRAEAHVAAVLAALQDAADVPGLRSALLQASALGIAEATPQLAGASPPGLDALRGQASVAGARLSARLSNSTGSERARLDVLCGARLPLLVDIPVPLDATAAADLGASSYRLAGTGAVGLRGWLADHARVRPAVAALTHAYDLAEVLGCADRLRLRATQLPVREPDAWIGVVATPRAGAVGIVVQRGYGDTLPAAVTGLAIDAWNQTVPAASHASGLAVHYDQPDASAPQAVLVAVPPDLDAEAWDLDTLLDTLRATLAAARVRAATAPSAGLTLRDES